MIEDIMLDYKNKCTRSGQFTIIFNFWIVLTIIFGIGGMIGIQVFIELDNVVPYIFRIYLSLLTVVAIEFIYFALVEPYIFYIEKKYIVKELNDLIKTEKDDLSIRNAKELIESIEKSRFKLKYMLKNNSIGVMYNKLKFINFLKNSLIDSKNVEQLNRNVKEHIKDKSNFKDIIDTAFWSIICLVAFTPVVEYFQSIFIPNTSNSFSSTNVSMYLISVITTIVIAFFINYLIHKINDFKNINEKRLLTKLSNKLDSHNFDITELESCFSVELDN